MKSIHQAIHWSMVTALFLLGASTVSAQTELSPGQKIVKRASDYTASLKSFTLEASMIADISVDGEKQQYEAGYQIAFKRPDGIAITMSDVQSDLKLYSDKTTTTRYIADLNQYIVEDKHTSPAELIISMSNPMFRPVLSVLAENTAAAPFTFLLEKDFKVTIVGEEIINKVKCDRIRFIIEEQPIDLWFSQGDAPLLQRIIPDMSKFIEEVKESEETDDVEFSLHINSDKWKVNEDVTTLLAFKPSEGAEKVTKFGPKHPLLEKEAPEIELTILNGDPFKLSSKKGKEIVVLDFWATWCGPCRQGMPILAKVVKEFEDKGVRLYAVNQGEGPEEIQGFLDSTGLDLTVVLDSEGVAGNAYQVKGIPLMVIVGRDGIVKQVHIGLTPTYEDDVRAELTELTK